MAVKIDFPHVPESALYEAHAKPWGYPTVKDGANLDVRAGKAKNDASSKTETTSDLGVPPYVAMTSVLEFIPAMYHAEIRAGTCTTDLTAYVAAALYWLEFRAPLDDGGSTRPYPPALYFPPGVYPIRGLCWTGRVELRGAGPLLSRLVYAPPSVAVDSACEVLIQSATWQSSEAAAHYAGISGLALIGCPDRVVLGNGGTLRMARHLLAWTETVDILFRLDHVYLACTRSDAIVLATTATNCHVDDIRAEWIGGYVFLFADEAKDTLDASKKALWACSECASAPSDPTPGAVAYKKLGRSLPTPGTLPVYDPALPQVLLDLDAPRVTQAPGPVVPTPSGSPASRREEAERALERTLAPLPLAKAASEHAATLPDTLEAERRRLLQEIADAEAHSRVRAAVLPSAVGEEASRRLAESQDPMQSAMRRAKLAKAGLLPRPIAAPPSSDSINRLADHEVADPLYRAKVEHAATQRAHHPTPPVSGPALSAAPPTLPTATLAASLAGSLAQPTAAGDTVGERRKLRSHGPLSVFAAASHAYDPTTLVVQQPTAQATRPPVAAVIRKRYAPAGLIAASADFGPSAPTSTGIANAAGSPISLSNVRWVHRSPAAWPELQQAMAAGAPFGAGLLRLRGSSGALVTVRNVRVDCRDTLAPVPPSKDVAPDARRYPGERAIILFETPFLKAKKVGGNLATLELTHVVGKIVSAAPTALVRVREVIVDLPEPQAEDFGLLANRAGPLPTMALGCFVRGMPMLVRHEGVADDRVTANTPPNYGPAAISDYDVATCAGAFTVTDFFNASPVDLGIWIGSVLLGMMPSTPTRIAYGGNATDPTRAKSAAWVFPSWRGYKKAKHLLPQEWHALNQARVAQLMFCQAVANSTKLAAAVGGGFFRFLSQELLAGAAAALGTVANDNRTRIDLFTDSGGLFAGDRVTVRDATGKLEFNAIAKQFDPVRMVVVLDEGVPSLLGSSVSLKPTAFDYTKRREIFEMGPGK